MQNNRDLWAIVLMAVANLELAVSGMPRSPWLTGFGNSAVLFLPGLLYSQHWIPNLRGGERILASLDFSLVLSGMSGFLLDRTEPGFSSSTWGIWLSTWIIIGAGWLWLKRKGSQTMVDPPRNTGSLVSPSTALFCSLAGLGMVMAFQVAGLTSSRLDKPLTSLWMVPPSLTGQPLKIFIENQEGVRKAYTLVVEKEDTVLYRQQVTLENQNTFQTVVAISQMNKNPSISTYM